MCHILLLLPLLALPIFYLFPLSVALPVYAAVLAVSAAVYWTALLAMNQPILNGAAGMIGKIGEVIEDRDGELLVRIQNEIWRVASGNPRPNSGDRVKVVGVKNLTLRVQKMDPDGNSLPGSPESPASSRIKRGLRQLFFGLEPCCDQPDEDER